MLLTRSGKTVRHFGQRIVEQVKAAVSGSSAVRGVGGSADGEARQGGVTLPAEQRARAVTMSVVRGNPEVIYSGRVLRILTRSGHNNYDHQFLWAFISRCRIIGSIPPAFNVSISKEVSIAAVTLNEELSPEAR
jgi:hypothetical protein